MHSSSVRPVRPRLDGMRAAARMRRAAVRRSGTARAAAGPGPAARGRAAVHPCDIADRADEHHQDATTPRPWRPAPPEFDPYDQQLHDEEEATFQHQMDWVGHLTDAELEDLQQQPATPDRDLHAKLRRHLPHTA
ncbi:hypothetical protein ACIG8S_30040 [[Kitasatospora] papulosa]|uniref:hypothetical protein n=1 Tax=[Kitasatospora] papulosa TaxID=1464011 RepID=UPI0037D5474E